MSGAPPEDVGSLGEEADKLISAVQDWLRRTTAERPIATGAQQCQWCPVCQLIALLRGERPDAAGRAGEMARTAVTALVAAFGHPTPGSPPAPPAPPDGEDRHGQRIDPVTVDQENAL